MAGYWAKYVLHAFLIFDFSNRQLSTQSRRLADALHLTK
jgi:hypothetical protein